MVVRVAFDIALGREFDYLVPPQWEAQVEVGTRVRVPFGARELLGVVTELVPQSDQPGLKAIRKVIGAQSLVTPKVLDLARWIAGYYCCPLEIALKSVLPDAVRKEEDGWRERLHVTRLQRPGEAPKLTARQEEVYRIVEEWGDLPLQELLRLAETTSSTVRKLEDLGLLRIAAKVSERDPHASDVLVASRPLALNEEQQGALSQITAAMDVAMAKEAGLPGVVEPPAAQAAGSTASQTFLLHGVTGSGKTEVYLQAMAYALERGRGAIVLVPEIALTPQTVERFKSRFSSGPLQTLVAVLHSHLSAGERHDEWHKIRQGRARIVIGARSAVFAPVEPLGLIVVDEEHEHSYKQEESPRYHARDVAVVRGQREGAVVVLGSATPSLESYHNAIRKKYRLVSLPNRATEMKLPVVRIVDMRQEQSRGGGPPPLFSNRLVEAITQRLERGEQTMLFLNRRGYSTSLQCKKCGYVAGCPNCSVSLTYHRNAQKLLCHICGHEERVPTKCPGPECGDPAIRFSGAGTERVEDTLMRRFPKARIRRMDSDTLQRKDDFRTVLNDFRTGKIDILVGTQMIAKGLHFPNVTLVGIIHADLSLHLPDFRAGERTFQLLTQVSGRAGRGDVEGEVIVQSFTPFHPAIQFARRHDFLGFYDQETEFREQLGYPPFSRVALLTLRGRNEDKVKFGADHLRKWLDERVASWPGTIIAGPAPAPLARAENYFRYQIMLRSPRMTRLSRDLATLTETLTLPDDLRLTVDIDPTSLL